MTCLICGSPSYKIEPEKLNSTYHRCRNCGFIFLDRSEILDKEDEKKRYDLHENSLEDKAYVKFLTKFIDQAVVPFEKNASYALDYGSGPEPVLSQILESKYKYSCKTYDLFYNPDLSYLDSKYDLITATEVFEHLLEPKEVFQKLANLLNNEGIFSIMTEFVPNKKDDFETWYYLRDRTHISFFTVRSMEILAELSSLELIYTNQKSYTTFKAKKI